MTAAGIWLKRLTLLAAVLAALVFCVVEALRITAVRRGVVAVDLPPGSEIAKRSAGADYRDAYRAALRAPAITAAEVLAKAPLPGREIARTEHEVVFEGGAPDLRFLASLTFEPSPEGGYATLSTVVFYDTLLGRAYFTFVGVGHRRLVPFELSRVARRLSARPG